MTASETERKLALLQHDCQSLASLDGIEKGERRAIQAIVSQIANIRHELTAVLSDQVLVPKEPTPEMIEAAEEFHANGVWYADGASLFGGIYKAMIAAAPPPSSTAGEDKS